MYIGAVGGVSSSSLELLGSAEGMDIPDADDNHIEMKITPRDWYFQLLFSSWEPWVGRAGG
jgi:hypothetical protein